MSENHISLDDIIKGEMEVYARHLPDSHPGYKGGCKKSEINNTYCGEFGSDMTFKAFKRKCPNWHECTGESFRQVYIEPIPDRTA